MLYSVFVRSRTSCCMSRPVFAVLYIVSVCLLLPKSIATALTSRSTFSHSASCRPAPAPASNAPFHTFLASSVSTIFTAACSENIFPRIIFTGWWCLSISTRFTLTA